MHGSSSNAHLQFDALRGRDNTAQEHTHLNILQNYPEISLKRLPQNSNAFSSSMSKPRNSDMPQPFYKVSHRNKVHGKFLQYPSRNPVQ
jgi:hypothetical protein